MNAPSPSFELRQFHAGLVFTRTSKSRVSKCARNKHGAALARSGEAEARELLAPVFDTRDLKEAKSLLDELSS